MVIYGVKKMSKWKLIPHCCWWGNATVIAEVVASVTMRGGAITTKTPTTLLRPAVITKVNHGVLMFNAAIIAGPTCTW